MDRTPLDTIVPVLMGCALLVWYTRCMSWTRRLAITAATLAIVLVVLLLERSGL